MRHASWFYVIMMDTEALKSHLVTVELILEIPIIT